MAESALAVDQHIPDALEAEMASLSSKTVSPDFLVFVEALKARFESSLDAVLLWERHEHLLSALYVGGSVVCAIAGLLVGLWIMRTALA